MKFSLRAEVNIAVEKALMKRGLLDGRASKFLASEVARQCDKYVPMRGGKLKNSARVIRMEKGEGYGVKYTGPYAHYQYKGEVYAGRAPKHPTGRPLTYSGAPMRGAYWDRRMMADKRGEIVRNLCSYIEKQNRGW